MASPLRLLLALVVVAGAPVLAAGDKAQHGVRGRGNGRANAVGNQSSGGRAGAADVARWIRSNQGGRVLSIDPERNGQGRYRVKFLDDKGNVRIMTVDPRQLN